ncbi:MAG: hypothetical protein QM753_05075 [Thermomicrobiales bacterium]
MLRLHADPAQSLLYCALLCLLVMGFFGGPLASSEAQDLVLEQRLRGENVQKLAEEARRGGDAARGAVVFHQPQTTCVKCHVVDGSPAGIGPELTALPRETTDEHLVESLLEPSKAIRQGFELLTILDDRRTIAQQELLLRRMTSESCCVIRQRSIKRRQFYVKRSSSRRRAKPRRCPPDWSINWPAGNRSSTWCVT